MRVKRIEDININQFVPKKSKIVQSKAQAPLETGGSVGEMNPGKASRPRRTVTSRRKEEAREKKIPTAPGARVSMPEKAGGPAAEPSDEQIRVRAYFISERRRRFALQGDAESDWLEARRQLFSELRPR